MLNQNLMNYVINYKKHVLYGSNIEVLYYEA